MTSAPIILLSIFLCCCVLHATAQHMFCESVYSKNCITVKKSPNQFYDNDFDNDAVTVLDREIGSTVKPDPAAFTGNYLKDKNYYKGYHRLKEIFPRDNIDTDTFISQQQAIKIFDSIRDYTVPGSLNFGGSTCITNCEWLANAAGVPFCSQCKRSFAIYKKRVGACLDFTLPQYKFQLASVLNKCQRYAPPILVLTKFYIVIDGSFYKFKKYHLQEIIFYC